MSGRLISYGVSTYAWKVALLPEHSAAGEQEAPEIDHRDDAVEEEAYEVWQNDVRDAIR